MSDDLRTRIMAVLRDLGWTCEYHEPVSALGECKQCDKSHGSTADAVIRELNVPDRTHVDDEGRIWEWCGGEPGTWAWRITRTGPEPLHSMYPRNPEGYDCEPL